LPIILHAILRLIEYLLNIPNGINNWVLVRVLHKHNQYKVVKSISSAGTRQLAVFAIYPGTTTMNSVLRTIDSLQKQSFSVLVVMNKNSNSSRFLNALDKKECSILLRQNIGADFGAYQTGIRYLKKIGMYRDINCLVLVNDSMFVTPTAQKSIATILDSTLNFNCIFVHHQGISHAGSMFLKFDAKILQAKEFNLFWNNYYPHINKRKIILHGEHKLTAAVGLKNFYPFINHDSLSTIANYQLNPAEILQLLTWSRKSSSLTHFYLSKAIENSAWKESYSYTLSNLQVSAALGLNLARVMGVPLKMDLKKSGLISGGEYIRLAQKTGCSTEEINELRQILIQKGGFLTDSFIKRVFKVYAMPQSNSTASGSKK